MNICSTVCFNLLALFAYSLSGAYSSENGVVVHENSLTEAEQSQAFYIAEAAIDMSDKGVFVANNATNLERKNFIAQQIIDYMRQNFGGNWYALVYDSDAQNLETGSALKSGGSHLFRYTSGKYMVLLFKFDTKPCMNERTHILDKINSARNSTVNLDLFHGFNLSEAKQISNIIFNEFLRNTTNFETNTCLNSEESKSTTIYTSTNCYYRISIDILELIRQTHPSVHLIIGESFFYSNYNTDIEYSVAFWLGPLYFLAYF